MVFSSYIFVFVFLPLTVAGYFLLGKCMKWVWQKLYLLIASVIFYGYFYPPYVLLAGISILVNYMVVVVMDRMEGRRRAFLAAVGILLNVGLLGYFKYYDFFAENLNLTLHLDLPLRNILLPLGISFYTFQQISFQIAVYKRQERIGSLLDYALFVLFFPQLVAGPIVHYSEMMPQFSDDRRRYFNAEHFSEGLYLFIIGLFKKTVIADSLALFADNGFGVPGLSVAAAWMVALSYTLQIYFDFCGYSDMAVGLGKMFNIDLPWNFNSPYKSVSVSEFWRRWHITLGRALSTFIYYPLGGNRKGKARTCLNLFVTFCVSGIWHGAGWTFVLWGMGHGALVVFERLLGKRLEKIPGALRTAGTFLLVMLLFVLFRADNVGDALLLYRSMFAGGYLGIGAVGGLAADGIVTLPGMIGTVLVIGSVVFLLWVIFTRENSIRMEERFVPDNRRMVFSGVLFLMAVICMGREAVFIYYNF